MKCCRGKWGFVKCGQIQYTKGFDGMIVTARRTPDQLVYYDVLNRRGIGVGDEERAKHSRLRAGIIGERLVDREWKELKVPHYLFHDLHTVNGVEQEHQMDTVFVCKHFVLVVEVKNISGRIDFDDERHQFVRLRDDGVWESFRNPVDQVKRHKELLEEWALDWSEYVPIEAAIVIANPNTVIGRVSAEVPIFNVSGLRSKVGQLVKKHEQASVNMRSVRDYLLTQYKPFSYGVKKSNVKIRNGVLCMNCEEVMVHGRYRFECMKCGWKDCDWSALRAAMHDYRALYGDEITNSQFREFAGVQSASTANKMLKRLFEKKNSTNW